jgi:DNA-binding beta-propeller fold protein YncE
MIKAAILTAALLLTAAGADADVSVKKIDFLAEMGLEINAAGPVIVEMDVPRGRLIVANTLSSSVSIIDCETGAVQNIPVGGRALQHLKAEAIVTRSKTGEVCLLGSKCLHIISPDERKAETLRTGFQFESVAVDEATGNVFVAGRESGSLGFYKQGSKKVKMLSWLDHSEPLINLNMTPPPPIRKVIADGSLGRVIAVDGFTSTLYIFDAKSGRRLSSRQLTLAAGGRWHLAGYDEDNHRLFIVTETIDRKVIQAASIDVRGDQDIVVQLPGFTEGVGMTYNPARGEVYIPYDNHASVHVVTFEDGGSVGEIKIPAYGNDASAVDLENDILYIASWAFGEIDVIDLETRRLVKRITDLGIIPHMFTMAFDPVRERIYYPKGATAVNGTFGAAVTMLDPATGRAEKIHTGWAPIDIIEIKDRVIVFESESRFAEVRPDGSYDTYGLPFDYPVTAIPSPEGKIYLSYGPHQSYWPTVYIWGAKNGIVTIDTGDFSFYDRRIPRQAHEMVVDRDGVCYFTQNNWGSEEQFIGVLEDEVRVFDPGRSLSLGDEVEREITQRILRYDPDLHRLYLVRVGERDEDPSILQVVDLGSRQVIARVVLGLTSTDLLFDDSAIYVANFDSKTVSAIDKRDFSARPIETGEGPLKLCSLNGRIFVVNHLEGSLQEIGGGTYTLPGGGRPDNIFPWKDRIVVTSHSSESLFIEAFDPVSQSFELLHREDYPFGETGFDTANVSFYVRGQYGDALFELTRGVTDRSGRLWITDFLSGKLFMLGELRAER